MIWARVSFIDRGVAKSLWFGLGHASKLPPKWQRWSMADGRRVFANRKLQALETICRSYSIIMVGLYRLLCILVIAIGVTCCLRQHRRCYVLDIHSSANQGVLR